MLIADMPSFIDNAKKIQDYFLATLNIVDSDHCLKADALDLLFITSRMIEHLQSESEL